MSASDAQKSEVHTTTADASTSTTAARDADTTRAQPRPKAPSDHPRDLEGVRGVRIVRDDTDSGGPLVIESDDPALQSLDLPKEEFPTERTPEIDPPVK
jgi:hypothetical protein